MVKGKYQDMPFEGRQLVGYDNMKKKFLSHWIDNMGTGFYPCSGSLDKTGKTRSESQDAAPAKLLEKRAPKRRPFRP